MRGLRMSGGGTNRLVLESRPFFLYQRAVIDKGVGKVEYSAGIRLPLIGEIQSAEDQRPLGDFDHLRIFAYYDLRRSDGTQANSFRYGVLLEEPVDESRLDEIDMPPGNGMLIAMPKTLLETHEVAEEVSRFLGMRVLVPARFRRPADAR